MILYWNLLSVQKSKGVSSQQINIELQFILCIDKTFENLISCTNIKVTYRKSKTLSQLLFFDKHLMLPWSAGECSGLVAMDMSVGCWDWLRGDDIITGNTDGRWGLSPIWTLLSLMTTVLSLRWRDASDGIGKSADWSLSSSVQSLLSTGLSWKSSSAICTKQTE